MSKEDQVILVDTNDELVGYCSKSSAHEYPGQCHRAFSVLLFDSNGQMLLQKRAANKMLWANCWSNSCCSHPKKGESIEVAVKRRLFEELGVVEVEIQFMYKFHYIANYELNGEIIGTENELCHVLCAFSNSDITFNPEEISAIEWRAFDQLLIDEVIENQNKQYTPWFCLEIEQLSIVHHKELRKFFQKIK